MTRHWFALASGLVLGTLFAPTTNAQVEQPTSFGQTSGVRAGWSQKTVDPAAARARYVVSPAPTQLAQSSTSSGRSFLPNWFGWRGEKATPQANSGQMRQKSGNTSGASRGATSAPSDAMPPDPANMQDVALPGLGGSPLPRKPGQPTTSSSNGNTGGSTQTQTGASSRALQSKSQSLSPRSTAGVRSASREPLTGSVSAAPESPSSSATRNSPGRRTAPHISPDELRRELSGTFPAPSTTNESTPHTAQADELAVAHDIAAKAKAGEAGDSVITDTPLALPTNPPAKESDATSAAKPQPFARPQIVAPSGEAASQHSADTFGTAQHSKSAYGTSTAVRMPFSSPAAPAPQTARGKEAFGEALQVASGGDPNVLASSQTPVLTVDIRGPKQILVGREALYRVRLQNQSDIPAEGIVAAIRVPAGADVLNTTATQGAVQPSPDGPSKGQLQWQLARLDRRANETLEIRLVPRESRPLELGVTWTLAPVGSRAVVEVQEAKLQLEIAGPTEVLFDKPQVFKLTLTNPGTGPAENVKIDLMPPGGGKDAVSSHPLGDLAAGATQTVEVELTARDAGKMFVKAVASAEGGLTCDAAKEIFCRKPELDVDWRGPATKYAGTMATYFIRVRNPGTAPTEDVTVHATLPDGAEFTSASEGQTYDAAHREVIWHIGTLSPGDDNYLEFKCVLKAAGTNRVKILAATAKGELSANKTAETNVVAIADLKLDVSDPSGPVAVGSQAVYEIHIHNRGANAAKDVNVIALFSEGIEPEQAEGAMYTVTDGRVSFHTIEELAAGRDVVLKIRAHAVQPGTHVFRAEVLCRDLEIKLAAEETTRFYVDEVPSEGGSAQKQAASRSEAFGPTVK